MQKIELLCEKYFGKKCFEVFKALCEKADENGFVGVKIEDLMNELNASKPTIINAFRLLNHKKILTKLKNGFYKLELS